MSLPSPVNPFEESADARGYIPRSACEETLRSLVARISDGSPAILLRGPAGIGKSMLLGVLQERLAQDRRIAYASVSPSPAPEISHRILNLLAEPVDDDPSNSLVAAAGRSAAAGRPVLVIIDHASGAPIASSLQLARASAAAGSDLCILFAVSEEDGADDFEREIGAAANLVTVRFDAAMNAQETSRYIEQRLDRTSVSQELRARLDEAALRWVIDGAHGLPRAVNQRASELLRRIESGEGLPALEQEAQQPSGPDAREHAAPSDQSPLQPHPTASADAKPPVVSLGGGLLGARYQREQPDLDDLSKLFPPGFLRSRTTQPESPGEPAAAAGASEADGEEHEARVEVEPTAAGPTEESASREVNVAIESAAFVEATSLDDIATPTQFEISPKKATTAISAPIMTAPRATIPAGTIASRSTRSKLSVAALIVTAVVGGYLAGRTEFGGTESSSREIETQTPAVLDAGPIRTAPVVASQEPLDRPQDVAENPPAAAASARPRDESTPRPPAVSNASSAAPRVIAAPRPTPAPEPRAEDTRKALAPSASEAAPPPEAPAPMALADDAEALADGSAPAIVVGAHGEAHPDANAVAYVRLRVNLEPGSTLMIDGETVGVAPFPDLIVEPGPHRFVAELPDGLQIEQLIDVTARTGIVEF